MRRLLLSLALVVGLLAPTALIVGPAAAHGDLVDGSPGPGDTVAMRTSVLRLELSDLDPDSPVAVALVDEDGDPLAVGEPSVVDRTTVCARSASLTAGVVTLEYAGRAPDGHRVGGRYAFEVGAPAANPEPGVCAGVDLARPGEARTLAEMTGTDGGVPTWAIAGLGGLAGVAAAGVAVRVRRDRREADNAQSPDDRL